MSDIAHADQAGAAEIARFVARNPGYYQTAFERIGNGRGFVWQFNMAAALLGPFWAGSRGLWGFFWAATIAELVALVQLCRGLFGNLGADLQARATRLQETASSRLAEVEAAIAAGNTTQAEMAQRLADNLQKAADSAFLAADAAASGAMTLILVGAGLLLAVKLAEGVLANAAYERQYSAWRSDKTVPSGVRPLNVVLSTILLAAIYPLTVYRFTATKPVDFLTSFPAGKSWFNMGAQWFDRMFDRAYQMGSGAFDGIRDAIRLLVDAFEMLLVTTPWPVVMLVIIFLAWRLAGARMAIFTAAAIAYLAFLGMWELSMQTVALLGAAAIICVVIGIPLGIWFARSEVAYTVARPVLDFMQTMPAFVYLIPVIAFFGTGKPPGIIATLIFGMPPVVRLTALGLKQVPEEIKEAGRAYGASRWQLLTGIELPLALPAIMTGVNQTILMCLSMVVIASLIGAQGLGSVVLEALQYAAKGQGMLAGFAILLCAMVIDRIVQGNFRRAD